MREGTSSGRKKNTVALESGDKMGPDGLLVLRRSTSVQTSGWVTPSAKPDLRPRSRDSCEQDQRVMQVKDTRSKHTVTQPRTNKTNVAQHNGEEASPLENTNIRFQTDVKRARAGSEHICQRLHNLQLDLGKILETRGTLESFQNLLREKGIHISDNVIKKISRAKRAERTWIS